MKKDDVLKKILIAAGNDKRMRLDPRYLKTMAFLTNKAFLRSNKKFFAAPNMRLDLQDAIWAGQKVEPRILEVLPAAVLRLNKHFIFRKSKTIEIKNLDETIADLKHGRDKGHDFLGVPYDKLKIWANFKLKDGRIKPQQEKKVAKNFRLSREAAEALKKKALIANISETECLERLICIE